MATNERIPERKLMAAARRFARQSRPKWNLTHADMRAAEMHGETLRRIEFTKQGKLIYDPAKDSISDNIKRLRELRNFLETHKGALKAGLVPPQLSRRGAFLEITNPMMRMHFGRANSSILRSLKRHGLRLQLRPLSGMLELPKSMRKGNEPALNSLINGLTSKIEHIVLEKDTIEQAQKIVDLHARKIDHHSGELESAKNRLAKLLNP